VPLPAKTRGIEFNWWQQGLQTAACFGKKGAPQINWLRSYTTSAVTFKHRSGKYVKNPSTYLSLFFAHKNILRVLEAAEKLPKPGTNKTA
jgi:hypothetical protein